MEVPEENTRPGFIHGTEVAQSKRRRQPGFEDQLPLLEREQGLKKKLTMALVVILSVFFTGMVLGAVLGIFV